MSKEIPSELASVGSLEFGKAYEIVATATTRFGVSGKDISSIADLLSAGAGMREEPMKNGA